MFFKRIEMTGFKSFATKTVVELKEGVTVVVGPNGCGKSNIFDAIRWVLGEQSAKSLRGVKMGDVVFQGSSTYKPMGCAQVTVIVNNEGRRLPIDFSEVSITRRLYRSGESEYQLNKVPCRLRDIHELFLDTGIGTDSYSIMEQGRIGDIIKSRPEDRREIFEEAAGISKYKIRKNEALRKLERTEHDLIRLADRIAEARTRRNSLKRQASKAERYKGLREAHDALDMKLLAQDLANVSVNIEEIEKEFSESQDNLAIVAAENDKIQSRREELLLAMQEAEETLRDLAIQKEDQRKYVHEITNEITRLQSQAQVERQRAEDMNEQLAEVSLRGEEFSLNLVEANAEEARLAVQYITLQSSQNVRRADYERLRADTASTREDIGVLRKKVEANNEEAMRLKNERSRLEFQIEMGRKAIEEFTEQKEKHQSALESLNAEVDEFRESLDKERERLGDLEADYKATGEKAHEAGKARETLLGEHRKTEGELHQASSNLKALERLAKDYEGYYAGVKSVMRASRDHKLDGIVGVVPELIQSIDPEHDLAIEIALGNHVQDVVVRSAVEAKRAIEFLKSERVGRATFLPLDLIDTREVEGKMRSVLGRQGVVGLGSRLVTCDSYVERVAKHLLGRTILTDNTDISLQLVREGLRGRYVTLDGQLTSPGGAMTGGSRRRSQIVSRQREITQLETTVRELTETEADLSRRVKKREESMVELNAQGERLRSAIQDLRLKLNGGESRLAALRDERDRNQKELSELQEKAGANASQSETRERDLGDCNLSLLAVEESIAKQRGEMALMEDAVYDRNEEVDRMGDHVNQADQEIAGLTERRSLLRERAVEFLAECDSVKRRSTQLKADQSRCRQEAKRLIAQTARGEAEKKELEEEVAGLAGRIEAIAKDKTESQNANREIHERSQRLLSDLTESNNRFNEAQANHINSQSQIERLRERAQDHFDRDLDELAKEIGVVEEDRTELTDELQDLKRELSRMGDNINMGALVEYKEASERYDFLMEQETDLLNARDSLTETIATIDKTTSKLFWEAFEQIRENFIHVYRNLFGGGKADLVLQKVEDGDSMLDGGIEIVAQPPGKKLQRITLLSGGEQALTAVSLMFAIFMFKPSPFCVLDEIDAPLDDANVLRFCDMLREFARGTQFIIVTHNKITMNLADTIYGITMQETGVSNIVSVAFDQVDAIQAGAVS